MALHFVANWGGSVDYVMTLCSILLFPLSLRYAMATPGGVCVQPCERVFLRLMQILTRSFFFWLLWMLPLIFLVFY